MEKHWSRGALPLAAAVILVASFIIVARKLTSPLQTTVTALDQGSNQIMQETNIMVTQANQAMHDLTRSMQDISQAREETQKIVKTLDSPKITGDVQPLSAGSCGEG